MSEDQKLKRRAIRYWCLRRIAKRAMTVDFAFGVMDRLDRYGACVIPVGKENACTKHPGHDDVCRLIDPEGYEID